MPKIEDVPIISHEQRLLNIRNYYASTGYVHGKYVRLNDRKLYRLMSHVCDGENITLSLMEDGKTITLPYNDPSIVIISNDVDLLGTWIDFNNLHLTCYYCKHHNEFVYGTGYYHQYQCPVCKNGSKDY